MHALQEATYHRFPKTTLPVKSISDLNLKKEEEMPTRTD